MGGETATRREGIGISGPKRFSREAAAQDSRGRSPRLPTKTRPSAEGAKELELARNLRARSGLPIEPRFQR
jgi:hypothetical protein